MSEYDMVDRLEKQIEGSNLALAAVAEVLQKMDSRLTKAEDEEFEMAQDEDDYLEKQEIIKAVAGEVYGLIKADHGMPDMDKDGSAKERKAKSMAKGKDDTEKAVTGTPSKPVDQQAALQAMQKQLNMLKAGWGFENDDDENMKDSDEEFVDDEENDAMNEDNGEPREPKSREHSMYSVENGQGYPLEEMQKQINQLTALVQGKFDIQKMVQGETEGRLRKMGFREETSLQRPTLLRYEDSLGVDGSTPITKTSDSPNDVVDQMMNMSYKDLRVLQERIESGETEGIPQEFIG